MSALLAVGLDRTSVSMLRTAGMIVEVCDHGGEFDIMDWSDRTLYDLIILNLAEAGGLLSCRSLRRSMNNMPVIGIQATEHGSSFSEQRATFLENGGDDLLPNPLNPHELVASSRAILRRVYDQIAVDIFTIALDEDLIRVSLLTHQIEVNGEAIHFTGVESRMAIMFATRLNRVLSKDALLAFLYANRPEDHPEIKIIDVFICKLRAKFNQVSPGLGTKLIKTIWGRGYCMEAKQIKEGLNGSAKPAKAA